MADYIDREELLELLQTGYESEEAPCWSTCPWIEDEIKRAPPVDAVEVVRCKDCKYGKKHLCYTNNVTNDDMGYCKWGEKE